MKRRDFLAAASLGGLSGCQYWPEDGFTNDCLHPTLPPELANHDVLKAAWAGVDPAKHWDCHVHLLGTGDSGSGAWVSSNLTSKLHPMQYLQYKFYLNAACIGDAKEQDRAYLQRLIANVNALPKGNKLLLLAFDFAHDKNGNPLKELSTFHIPNKYAASVQKLYPKQTEWAASIHPYRKDAVEALEEAAAQGARAVKWLPPAMLMDPISPKCDPFFEAMAKLDLPLLSHGGEEKAVHAKEAQAYANPLKFKRALDHGVRVIIAHCASLGAGVDLDKGANGPEVSNFKLFARLMDDPKYEGKLFGEISAMTQVNRIGEPLDTILERTDWHPRLVNGSDYPLPGVSPLFSVSRFEEGGYLTATQTKVIRRLRQYNPLAFDFVLKRSLSYRNKQLSAVVFDTQRIFGKRV